MAMEPGKEKDKTMYDEKIDGNVETRIPYVIKRSGARVPFNRMKIVKAITGANNDCGVESDRLEVVKVQAIADGIEHDAWRAGRDLSVEEIQDRVEDALISAGKPKVAKAFILYRYRHAENRKMTDIDKRIESVIKRNNEEVNQENSNKNPTVLSTQRDYMAGEWDRYYVRNFILPDDIMRAHDEGIIHVHDTDYIGMSETNCCLINLKDMLENGTAISGTHIDPPKSFATACTVMSQISAAVASSQYGGQTMSLAHLAPFVDVSRQKLKKRFAAELPMLTKEQLDSFVEKEVIKEVEAGCQTIQYQEITLSSTNGQAPFITLFMYLDEVPEGQTRDDLALIIKVMLEQRMKGVKDRTGHYVTPAFPKLIYALDEDNIHENSKYYYLTKLAAECTAKRMVPDYISAKIMRQLKGDTYPCMGAARGEEKVSIRINDVEYCNIMIKDAFSMIRNEIRAMNHNNAKDPKLSQYRGKCGVYKVTHTPTGLYYIGSSTNIARRLTEHRYSCMHKGTLGDNYYVGDYDTDHLAFELLEECSIDDLYKVESKYVHFKEKDALCVNQKDPINNGNFTSDNRLKALHGDKYSTYINKWNGTWYKEVPYMTGIYIKSHGEWVPVRGIFYNNEKCPLKQLAITYCASSGTVRTIHVTEDHPLETQRGRVFAGDITLNDQLVDANTYEYVKITDIHEISANVPTYDFTVDNDMFDLSGIISHNCRSFLTPDNPSQPEGNCNAGNIAQAGDYFPGQHKYYGRFNQGVVTINLVDVACSAVQEAERNGTDKFDTFWKIFDERLELCHKALQIRHNTLLGTPSDVAPILWQDGALARLKPGETIDKLLYGNYSTISLGYAGLYEACVEMTGKSHTDPDVQPFALKVMQVMNDKCTAWRAAENISYSLYGTPLESTTYKFAKCLQRRFGKIKDVTDHNYITNSYHVNVREPINAFDKLTLEAEFQQLSPGGAVSYVEVPNMQNNIQAVLALMKHIYNTIMYAELNTKSDYCDQCGYDGEIQIVKDSTGKLIWKCPNCGCTDQRFLHVARRTCGYIGTQFWNQGRTEEIAQRVLHL